MLAGATGDCTDLDADPVGSIAPAACLRYTATMSHSYDVVVERDVDGIYVASVPALHGCHTQANSLDVLMERAREAIELCLEVRGVEVEELEFVGVQRVRVVQ